MKLEKKVAIVTGAGRNIGEAIARAFVAEGARAAVVDIDEARARSVAESLNAERADAAIAIPCDVTAGAEVERMVTRVAERWGRLDILVNNVGVVDRKTVLELEESEWDRVIAITLKSVFLCAKHAGRRMAAQGEGGRIINMASSSGHRGRGDATAYPSAKGGVLNLTRSLAVQLAPFRIRVNSISPHRVRTEVAPGEWPRGRAVDNLVGRQCIPEEVARLALFLVSDDADFLTGADFVIDGGALAG